MNDKLKKLDNLINEEFYKLLVSDPRMIYSRKAVPTEVFVNPTRAEVRSIYKDYSDYQVVRFLIDLDNGDQYVWGAKNLLHGDVINDVRPEKYIAGSYNNMAGVGEFYMFSCNPEDPDFVFEKFKESDLPERLGIKRPIKIIESYPDYFQYEGAE